MGGAPVYVEADGIFVGKADFAQRHQVEGDFFFVYPVRTWGSEFGGAIFGIFDVYFIKRT